MPELMKGECLEGLARGGDVELIRQPVGVVAASTFAGWKNSFEGDLHADGRDAVDSYMCKKVVTSRWT